MKKFLPISLLLLLISFSGISQKKELTIEDAVIGQWRQLAPKSLSGVQAYGEDGFSYVKDYKEINLISESGIAVESIIKLEDINIALKEGGYIEIKHFPYWDYSWRNKDQLVFNSNGYRHTLNIKENKLVHSAKIPNGAEHINFCKENNYIAYTIENNLYFLNNLNKSIQITNDEDKGIVNGNSYVHRQEFGINNGIFWSPKGSFIAFYRKDERSVTNYPLVDITTRIATVKNTKYPMIGEKSEEVTLGIYNLKTGKIVFAKVTDFTKERYLTSITWGPEEKYIYIGVLNRGQDHLKLNKYDAETGKFIKTLFEEKNARYVEPEHPLIFVNGLKDQFLWFSERDGYNHLYLYNTQGKMIKQLTKGNWVVLDFLGFDKKNMNFYVTATKDSPIETHLYEVNFKKRKKRNIKKLTNTSGNHRVVLSNSKNFFYDSYSNINIPQNSNVVNTGNLKSKQLLSAENPLNEYKLGEMKLGVLKAADGETDLHYRIITPPDFDPAKKYPVVVYVYGGPHAQLVNNSWLGGTGLWAQYMAQKGYVMFTIDNRGSSNRGFEFESIIHRQCGQEEMKDQMKGIDFLKTLPYIDTERIGVHGWSYGGFMTTSLMTTYPEIFKVGVAGGPVTDWKFYEVMYGERYMDTPKENPEGFKKASLLNKADKLQGRESQYRH